VRTGTRIFLLAALVLGIWGCETVSNMGNTEKGAVTGGALGAGLGAIVGNQVGSTGAGIAIGSAIGAVSGGLIGAGMDANQEDINATDRRLSEQERELAENRRLLEELKGRGLDVRTTSRGVVVNLPDVLFQFDSSRLTEPARRTVGEIVNSLRGAEGRRISVEGHTDSVGTVAYNQRLSEDRARSVATVMTDNGIARRRISVRGFGEMKPIASNSTESGRAKNRRVEVIIENS